MNTSSRDYTIGVAAVLFSAIVWGTTGTAATFAPEVGAIAMVLQRWALVDYCKHCWPGVEYCARCRISRNIGAIWFWVGWRSLSIRSLLRLYAHGGRHHRNGCDHWFSAVAIGPYRISVRWNAFVKTMAVGRTYRPVWNDPVMHRGGFDV